MDLTRLKPGRRSLQLFAVGGAWFFVVVSLLFLLGAIGAKWAEPHGTFKLYHTIVDDVSYDAWALSYTGVVGLVFAMAQMLVVGGAVVASTLPFDRTLKARRAGHVVLCGWSALWAINLMWLAGIDGQLDSFAQATLLCVLFGCTTGRAYMGWSPGRSQKRMTEPPRDEPLWAEPTAPAAVSETVDPDPGEGHPGDAGPGSFSARVAMVLNWLVGVAHAAMRWIISATPRARLAARAVRRRSAAGLHHVADFTRKQAGRVAPDTRN